MPGAVSFISVVTVVPPIAKISALDVVHYIRFVELVRGDTRGSRMPYCSPNRPGVESDGSCPASGSKVAA